MNVFSRKSLFVPAIVAVLAAGLWLYKTSDSRVQALSSESAPRPVHVSTLSPVEFQPVERFSGFVRGAQQSEVRSQTSGTITYLNKEPGDSVRTGEILATFEADELSTASQSALLSLNSAKESLQKTHDFYDQKINEAEANLEKVKENKRNGEATKKDVNIAEEALQSAKRLRDAEISRAESGVTSTQGNTKVAQAYTQKLTLVAPFSGIITSKIASVGSFVSAGTVIYTIASPSNLEITVSVPARIVKNLSQGASVSIFPEGSTSPIKGSIFSFAPAVSENTSETSVRIRLKNTDESIAPLLGQYAEVEFPAGTSRVSLLIPESAIVRTYDDTFVFTARDGKAHRQPVALGTTSGSQREILSGLQPGDRLITEGMHTLQEGMNIGIYGAE